MEKDNVNTKPFAGLSSALVLLLLVGCGGGSRTGTNEGGAGASGAPAKSQDGRAGAPSGGQPERPLAGKTLELFVGSASKPPTEQCAKLFEEKTGARLLTHFGGSGLMLSQAKLSERGDIYFPGSSDFMELAKREGLVLPETEQVVVYLVPAINVPRGNPKGVFSLEDLCRPGTKVGIARPDTVCVGLYAVEVLEKAGLGKKARPNIATYAESCEKTAQLVALGSVDAVIGWSVFEHWNPDKIQTVPLPPERVSRIGYIPVAILRGSREPELARAFIAFLRGEEGLAVFRKWHYFTTEAEARRLALPTTPVGGEWPLPEEWK